MDDVTAYAANIEACMMDIVILLNQKFSSAFANELSTNQQLVLTLISKNQSLTVRKIAETINVSMSAVSQMISKMEQMQLVKRMTDPHDRRLVQIQLSEKGKQLIKRMEKTRHEIITNYLSKMNLHDLRVLSEKMKKLRDVIWMEGERRTDETQ